MSNNQNPARRIIPRNGSFFQDLTDRFRLISRLIMDSRVNPLIKILPIGTLIYVVSPIDLLSVNPIDDAFIIWLGTTLFVELCPPSVVEEHLNSLRSIVSSQWKGFTGGQSNPAQGEVIDGEYFDTDPNASKKTTTPR